MLINTLPIRVSLAGRSAREVVAETYQRLTELLNHEQASLSLAKRCSGVPATMPLFTTILNYRHSRGDSSKEHADAAALAWEGIQLLAMQERTNYPVNAAVDDLGRGFALTIQCLQGVDPERVAGYLQTALESLIAALARESKQPLLSLAIVPE